MSNQITLANLGGGAAVEKFEDELQRVVENILDPNTEPEAKREVILKVAIKPDKDREFGAISIVASCKLAPASAYNTRAYFGQDAETFVAYEDNPRQTTIDDFIQQENQAIPITNVPPMTHVVDRDESGKITTTPIQEKEGTND